MTAFAHVDAGAQHRPIGVDAFDAETGADARGEADIAGDSRFLWN
jgi:hypothetical protein